MPRTMDPDFLRRMMGDLQGMTGENQAPPNQGVPNAKMWRTQIYQMDTLIVDHAQNDYGKVLRFTVNGLVELMNGNVQDFRITMADDKGNVYFFVVGPATQLKKYKKVDEV